MNDDRSIDPECIRNNGFRLIICLSLEEGDAVRFVSSQKKKESFYRPE